MKKLVLTGALLLSLGLPLMAGAQPSGNPPGRPDGSPGSTGPVRKPALSPQQLAELLRLVPEQQPLWDDYLRVLALYTSQHYREQPAMAFAQEPALRQIGRLVVNLQNRLTVLEDIEIAAKKLYATLGPEQQKLADQHLLATIPTFAAGTDGQPDRPPRGGAPGGGGRSRPGGGPGGGGGMNSGSY